MDSVKQRKVKKVGRHKYAGKILKNCDVGEN
jgi:hypothetical protein